MCAGPLAALALAASLGACGSTAEPRPAASPGPAATAAGAVDRVEPRQRAGFALLRTRPEGLPGATRRILGRPVAGMSWRLAQRIPLTLSGAYWLVPGDGHLCVVEQAAAGGGVGTICARTADALEHGVASVTVAAPSGAAASPAARTRLIVGVAPDGVRAVRVHTMGAVATAPVYDHVFVLRDAVAAPPDFLRLRR